jgi:hypothetical protein
MTIGKALALVSDSWSPNGKPKGAPNGVHLTDWGNAQRLIHQCGDDLRFVHPWGKWLVWNGGRWELDNLSAVETLAKRVIADLFRRAASQVEAIGEKLNGIDD